MNAPRRCGVTSPPTPDRRAAGGGWGCCREDGHPGLHCAHWCDNGNGPGLTGTAGVTVVSRGLLGTSFGHCDGTKTPTGDRIVIAKNRPGDRMNHIWLIPPDEANTRRVGDRTPPTEGTST